MYCNFCNSQLPEGVHVCAVCGHDNAPVATPAPDYVQAESSASAPQSTAYESAAPEVEAKPAKKDDPLSSAVSALVWGCLSAIMSFGGLFRSLSFEGAIAGIIMAAMSKIKAKSAKACPGTTAAALAKGAGAASTFGLIASIYSLVNFIVVMAILFFFYFIYFILIFIAAFASSGMMY